jgi:hypothetical protein
MFSDFPDLFIIFSLQVSFGYASVMKLSKRAKFFAIFIYQQSKEFSQLSFSQLNIKFLILHIGENVFLLV